MLAGLEALQRLLGVHLRRRGEDHRVESRNFQAFGEIGRDVADAVLRRRLFRLVEIAPDERDRLDPVDQFDRIEMLEAEGAGAGQRDFDRLGHERLRRSRCAPSLRAERQQSEAAGRLRRFWIASPRVLAGQTGDQAAFSKMRCPTAVLDAGTW